MIYRIEYGGDGWEHVDIVGWVRTDIKMVQKVIGSFSIPQHYRFKVEPNCVEGEDARKCGTCQWPMIWSPGCLSQQCRMCWKIYRWNGDDWVHTQT